VALVITELDVGGAENAMAALATGLDRRRWDARVIALGPEGALAGPIREAGVSVMCLGVNPRRPIRAIARLAAALRRPRRVALVQSSLFHANVCSRLAAPWAGRPWVVGGLRVAERQKRWHLVCERATIPLAAGAVCVSEGVKRFSQEVGGWPSDRLSVVPNAVDTRLFDQTAAVPREWIGVPTEAFLALFVGRLDVQKGVDVLLDAAAKVMTSRPDWHLVLAGDGPLRATLVDRLATSQELARRIRLLGQRNDVPGLLQSADLLVLPSRWEGMPNAVLEAMAARRAVVATRVEGSEELVVPRETGWLVAPGDPEALASALLDAAADRDRLRRYGEAGRARVELEHTPSRTILAYERLWAGLLGLEDPDRAR
jgi:starch synthase (maltosyl-transferring)